MLNKIKLMNSVLLLSAGMAVAGTGESAGTESFNSFSMGPGYLAGVASNNVAYVASYGKYFRAVDYAGIRLNATTAADFKGNNYFTTALVGLQAYLTQGEISPYGFLDFGFGYEFSDKYNSDYGFTMGAGPGVLFFRKASAQLFVEPTWQMIFGDHFGQLYALKVGVNF